MGSQYQTEGDPTVLKHVLRCFYTAAREAGRGHALRAVEDLCTHALGGSLAEVTSQFLSLLQAEILVGACIIVKGNQPKAGFRDARADAVGPNQLIQRGVHRALVH